MNQEFNIPNVMTLVHELLKQINKEKDSNRIAILYQSVKTILDILTTGEIPLAPAELLSNEKLEELINLSKDKYDYIILDTTPTSLVTDTLLISDIADITIYIAKSNFTDKKSIAFAEELITTQKLKNVSYVLNYVESDNLFKRKTLKKVK